MLTDIQSALEEFLEPIIDTVKEVWDSIYHFFAQYMADDAIKVLVFGIGIAIVLIIVLAVINRK